MSSIKLTPAEQGLIEANRASEQIAKDQKAAEEAIRVERVKKEHDKYVANVRALRDALKDADENNITFLTTVDGKDRVCFLLNGKQEEIKIEVHRVTDRGSWSSRNNGLKYTLHGGFNDYCNRYYKNPKSVIKTITKFQELAANRATRAEANLNLGELATKIMKRKYPKATVEFHKGFDYRNDRYRPARHAARYQPDTVKVGTPNGTVEFSYHKGDKESLLFTVVARWPSAEINEKLTALILE